MINDAMLLLIGVTVLVLALIGVWLTVRDFQDMPRRQKPVFKKVALQAQPRNKPGALRAQRRRAVG